jgi:uncharacterized membrane protein YgdD (TMEM256/DUF423 family)
MAGMVRSSPIGREMFDIAAEYQMAHALALLAVAWLYRAVTLAGLVRPTSPAPPSR